MGVSLRAVETSDLPILYQQQLDRDAVRMAAFPSRDHDAFMAHWAKIMSDRAVIARVILFDDRVAGNIGSYTQGGRRLVGYWLGREFWGRGIATQALAALLQCDHSRPIHAYVAKHNVGSIRVLEKCGFTVRDEGKSPVAPGGGEIEEFLMRLD